jgi:hypothetical protein
MPCCVPAATDTEVTRSTAEARGGCEGESPMKRATRWADRLCAACQAASAPWPAAAATRQQGVYAAGLSEVQGPAIQGNIAKQATPHCPEMYNIPSCTLPCEILPRLTSAAVAL